MDGHLSDRQIKQALSDADEARSKFEPYRAQDEGAAFTGSKDPDPPVEINHVANLRADDFGVRRNAVEQRYPNAYQTTPPGAPDLATTLELFEYHAPNQEQVDDITAVRESMKETCRAILRFVPPSAERTLAIRALHQASMHANSAIVFAGRRMV